MQLSTVCTAYSAVIGANRNLAKPLQLTEFASYQLGSHDSTLQRQPVPLFHCETENTAAGGYASQICASSQRIAPRANTNNTPEMTCVF